MNEVRATLSHVVTRDDLRALHEAQSAEMKTYVQAETAPLHAGIAQLSTDFKMVAMDAVDHDERIDKLETNVTELRKRVDSQQAFQFAAWCASGFRWYRQEKPEPLPHFM